MNVLIANRSHSVGSAKRHPTEMCAPLWFVRSRNNRRRSICIHCAAVGAIFRPSGQIEMDAHANLMSRDWAWASWRWLDDLRKCTDSEMDEMDGGWVAAHFILSTCTSVHVHSKHVEMSSKRSFQLVRGGRTSMLRREEPGVLWFNLFRMHDVWCH